MNTLAATALEQLEEAFVADMDPDRVIANIHIDLIRAGQNPCDVLDVLKEVEELGERPRAPKHIKKFHKPVTIKDNRPVRIIGRNHR